MKISKSGRRYLIVGVGVYLFELLVIIVSQGLGTSAVVAVGLSFWLGLGASFGLQKLVTFEDRRLQRRILLPQILAFCLLVVFNFAFTVLMVRVLENRFSALLIRTVALAITTLWNFYLYKTRIFKSSGEPAVY